MVNTTEKEIVVDSSKKQWLLNDLIDLHEAGSIELKPVFLVKDGRGWTSSMKKIENKRSLLPRPALYTLYKWYLDNKELQNFLNDAYTEYYQISYEKICFETEKAMTNLFDFAGVDPSAWSLDNQPTTHIAYGNRMKKESSDSFQIRYDDEWFRDYEINTSMNLLPHIFFWNKRNVYGRGK